MRTLDSHAHLADAAFEADRDAVIARAREAGVSAEDVLSGSYELEIACRRYTAKVSLQPLYDPKMERIKV